MKINIQEIASLINGSVSGDINTEIVNLSKIEEAVSGDLTFLYLPTYDKFFSTTKASAIIVKTGFSKSRKDYIH
jgi:UDP-3-O-[3-hydroxymyristoyl] glucosamine N-acyltransferase